jgi:hypothetical protein
VSTLGVFADAAAPRLELPGLLGGSPLVAWPAARELFLAGYPASYDSLVIVMCLTLPG